MQHESRGRGSAVRSIESLEPRRLLAGDATLDLTSNAVVVDYPPGGWFETLRAMIISGYSGGAWQGAGLVGGSSAHATSGVGYAEANPIGVGSTFSGTVTDGLLVPSTRYGDANLNGVVNLADFNRLVTNFHPQPVWKQGDFDYNGVVNLADFYRLASNVGLSAAGPEITPSDWAALGVATTGQPAYFVEGRTLVVRGTPKADRIVVDMAKLDEMKVYYPRADIRRISVDAGAGDDHIEIKVGIISTIAGARGNDTIIGSAKGDVISGGAGDDVLMGGGGDDRLDGLDGYDRLEGGAGNDSLSGGKGHDTLFGNDGDDVLFGGGGTDWLYGGRGADTFKTADILGNRDRIGFDRRADSMLGSDADDEYVRDLR